MLFALELLRAELLYQTGRVEVAAGIASDMLRAPSVDPQSRAKLTYILSMAAFERGQFVQSLEYINRSVLLSEAAMDSSLSARALLGLLRVADADTSTVPLIANVRKAVARSGDPHFVVALRLHFARVEASRHSPLESRRHLLAANDLLSTHPNVWLQGRIHLGLSVVDTLCGDPVQCNRAGKVGDWLCVTVGSFPH